MVVVVSDANTVVSAAVGLRDVRLKCGSTALNWTFSFVARFPCDVPIGVRCGLLQGNKNCSPSSCCCLKFRVGGAWCDRCSCRIFVRLYFFTKRVNARKQGRMFKG